MKTTTNETFRAIDPHTGCVLRDATSEEIAVWRATSFLTRDVRVGEVLVSQHLGEGLAPWSCGDN